MRIRRRGLDGLLIALAAASATLAQADLEAPPRYDGAGYAVLARSLLEGTGYRAIDHPDRPPHAHFPPGYPAFLAAVWWATGPSFFAARAASVACTVAATLVAWRWFRTMYARPAAFALGLALAVNWAWSRAGSGIQSEPFYALLGWLGIRLTVARRPRGQALRGLLAGEALAAALLTRQVGIGLVAAALLELRARGLRRALATAAVAIGVLVGPWLAWSAMVGRDGAARTQAALMFQAGRGIAWTVPAQVLFYAGRIPDQLTAPVVESATVFGRSARAKWAAVAWAGLATAAVLGGWAVALGDPRRRIAGLAGFATLTLLVAWPYTEAGRFLIPLIPALLVGAVEGLTRAGRAVGLRPRRVRSLAARLMLLAALPYAAYSAATADRRLQAERDPAFDAACEWLRRDSAFEGPILTRHPGEVFLRTGNLALEVPTSERPGSPDAGPDEIAATIRRYGVAYLLIDSDRYAHAVASPLERYVRERPRDVREAFRAGGGAVRIYEAFPDR